MRQPFRITLGLWLEQFTFLHPVLLRYSHVRPDGRPSYINRVSRTFAKKDN